MQDERWARQDPCADSKLPEVHAQKVKIPTTAEVVSLHDKMTPEYAALVHVAAAAGLRQGEAFGLTVDRIDFLRREVRIDRQVIYLKGNPQFGPPKRSKSIRTVPLPQPLIDELAAHIAAHGTGDHGLLFTHHDGSMIRKSSFNGGAWRRAVKASTAPDTLTFHQLRHYYASLLIRFGESVKTVQARLGHATAAETLDVYGHLWHDSDDRTREAAAAALVETNGGTTVGLQTPDTADSR